MLGSKIRELRKEAKYTQEDLARLLRNKYGLGTDRAMVSKWETGFQEPQTHTLKCIADLFGVTIDELSDNAPPDFSVSLKNVEYRKDSIHLVPINPQYTSEIINGADMDCVHILGVPKLLIRDIDD